MADVIKAIKATGGDYTTPTNWEAADGGATASDNAIGELYSETYTDDLTINSTVPATWVLRANAAHRHEGIENTGPIIQSTSFNYGTVIDTTVQVTLGPGYEYDGQGNNRGGVNLNTASGGSAHVIRGLLIYDHGTRIGINGNLTFTAYNNIIYDTSIGIDAGGNNTFNIWYNTCCYNSVDGIDAFFNGATADCRNNACFANTTQDNSDAARRDTTGGNATSDTSGDTGLTSLTTANQFVDPTGTPRDLRLKAGANCLGNAVTGTGITVDCVGTARDGSTPDIGAFEFIPPAGGLARNIPTLKKRIFHKMRHIDYVYR